MLNFHYIHFLCINDIYLPPSILHIKCDTITAAIANNNNDDDATALKKILMHVQMRIYCSPVTTDHCFDSD